MSTLPIALFTRPLRVILPKELLKVRIIGVRLVVSADVIADSLP